MKKISVVVPIYNVEKFLVECIESILNQTYQNFELFLINDGSPDNCDKICKEYALKDKRVKYFYKKNKGVSSARNLALSKLNSYYTIFIDPDDYIQEDYFENIMKFDKNNDLIIFGYNEFSKNKKNTNSFKECLLDKGQTLERLLEDSDFCGFLWNKVFKTNLIVKENIKFDTKIHMCEDLLFCYEYILKSKKVYVSEKKFYNYRIRKNSAMNKNSLKRKATSSYAYEKMYRKATDEKIKIKLAALYLKNFYKYKKVSKQVFDFNLLKECSKKYFHKMSKTDRIKIRVFKYCPFLYYFRNKLNDLIYKKF